jgi:hypothetical protein
VSRSSHRPPAPRLTKVPMVSATWRITARDKDLLYISAKRDGLSQSDWVRDAIRQKAARDMADERPAP